MPKTNPIRKPDWMRDTALPAPFTPEQDEAIIEAARLGFVTLGNPLKDAVPERRYGDILERRNELKEAGRYTPEAPL